jgi:hypothetical protein
MSLKRTHAKMSEIGSDDDLSFVQVENVDWLMKE